MVVIALILWVKKHSNKHFFWQMFAFFMSSFGNTFILFVNDGNLGPSKLLKTWKEKLVFFHLYLQHLQLKGRHHLTLLYFTTDKGIMLKKNNSFLLTCWNYDFWKLAQLGKEYWICVLIYICNRKQCLYLEHNLQEYMFTLKTTIN